MYISSLLYLAHPFVDNFMCICVFCFFVRLIGKSKNGHLVMNGDTQAAEEASAIMQEALEALFLDRSARYERVPLQRLQFSEALARLVIDMYVLNFTIVHELSLFSGKTNQRRKQRHSNKHAFNRHTYYSFKIYLFGVLIHNMSSYEITRILLHLFCL